MKKKTFTVVSLFSGCGGSSLGYRLAGGKILLAVENDDHAVETYRLNFPETPVWKGDICELAEGAVLELTKLKSGQLDVLDGSPPCQGFSTANHNRNRTDPRNSLFKQYVRILRALQPKVFVMENVSGLVKGKMRPAFVGILKELKATGYNVRAKVLNAMYFDVPQSRERMIFSGTRKDIGKDPVFPSPRSAPVPLQKAIGKDGYIIYRHNYGKGICNFKKHKFDRTCLTLTKTGMNWEEVVVGDEKRFFNTEEMKTIGSFPSGFKFSAGDDPRARIGNAVPPNFMRAIAETIRDEVLG